MPWGSSILIDCRAKRHKVKPMKATPEMRMNQMKRNVGEALGGTVHELKESHLGCSHPRYLDGAFTHHVYLRRRLRDTPSILKDVMRKARLPSPKKYMPPRPEVPARVETRLIAPPTPPIRNLAKSESIESL